MQVLVLCCDTVYNTCLFRITKVSSKLDFRPCMHVYYTCTHLPPRGLRMFTYSLRNRLMFVQEGSLAASIAWGRVLRHTCFPWARRRACFDFAKTHSKTHCVDHVEKP